VPLPTDAGRGDIRSIGVRAIERSGRTGSAPARLTRINKAFMLDDSFAPGQSRASWEGSFELRPGDPPLEIPIK
jgi:hypothetical protein